MADKDYYETLGISKDATDEEINKMQEEAKQYAEEDKKHKEEIDVKNQADSLVYQSEKTLKDLGDKATKAEKDDVNAKADALKKVKDGDDVDAIKKASEELSKSLYSITSRLYSQTNNGQANQQQGDNNKGNDNKGKNGESGNGDYTVE